MTDTTIPLSTDQTAADIAGLPKPLTPDGDVTITNPDAPVNLGPNAIVVDGVVQGVPDDPNPITLDVYPTKPNLP